MNDLTHRVEEASMNAWPATHQLLLDGWLIRLSNGFTKRANCVVPLYYSTEPTNEPRPEKSASVETRASPRTALKLLTLDKIRYCENLFAREQLQTIFRLTSHPQSAVLDDQLAQRGYSRVDETQVQLLDLRVSPKPQGSTTGAIASASLTSTLTPAPQMRLVPIPQWLRIYAELAEMPATAIELHSRLIRSIRLDCAFAVLELNDQPIGCALGVLEHDLVGLFDLITAREYRGKGYAELLLRGLLQWGDAQGAQHAYLQVIKVNSAAVKLYKRLGFQTLYNYWYRLTS